MVRAIRAPFKEHTNRDLIKLKRALKLFPFKKKGYKTVVQWLNGRAVISSRQPRVQIQPVLVLRDFHFVIAILFAIACDNK